MGFDPSLTGPDTPRTLTNNQGIRTEILTAAGSHPFEVRRSEGNPQHGESEGSPAQSPRADQPPTVEELRGAILAYANSLEVDPNDRWAADILNEALAYCQNRRLRQAREPLDRHANMMLSTISFNEAW